MIMQEACPICGSENLRMNVSDDEYSGSDDLIRLWDCVCGNGHEFIISEVLTVTSRLVAKDPNDLERLILEEEKEVR